MNKMKKCAIILLVLICVFIPGCGSVSQEQPNGTTEGEVESEGNPDETTAATESGSVNEGIKTVTAWSECELNGFGEILYPGFTLDSTAVEGKEYRTLVSDEDIRIVDNGMMPLSYMDNDSSAVYTFSIVDGSDISTYIIKSPIGGYEEGMYTSRTPKVMEQDVTGDGIKDIIIRDEDYDKDDGRTLTDLYVYDSAQKQILKLSAEDVCLKLQNQFTATVMTYENGTASCTISDNNGNTVEFAEELSENVVALSDVDINYYSNYLMVEDGTIYAGLWLSAYYDYEDGYIPVTGNYTTYVAALRVPLVFDTDSYSFVYGDDSLTELVEGDTYNYAQTIDDETWDAAWNNAN